MGIGEEQLDLILKPRNWAAGQQRTFEDVKKLVTTPDSVFPLAFGFSGESLLSIPFRHKLLELYCHELWSVVADQGGRDYPISRSVPSAHGLLLSL